MKLLFAAILAVLALSSVATWWRMPEVQSEVPVLYWVTDPNPARQEQVALFHQWLEKYDHPRLELRLDTANSDDAKKVIQGVSGVAGDIMDVRSGTGLRYFHALGILDDVTKPAKELGFDPSRTWPAMEPEITVDRRQYMFSCSVNVWLYWVSRDTFARVGLPTPPRQWDIDTFERIGRQFVAAANRPGQRHRTFFADQVDRQVLRRSMGLGVFNETGTRCTLDDPRNVELLQRLYRWMYVDRILPSAADVASFAAETGYGGLTMQLFNRGNYGMILSGRHALIQLRTFDPIDLDIAHPPHDHFPNAFASTRSAAVYAGSPNRELAYYFLKYLASEEYNMLIVRDADALPANPELVKTEAYLRPPDHPNEWGTHEAMAEALATIAIGGSYSPFVLPSVVERLEREATDEFLAGRITAAQAARQAADRINDEIQRTLHEHPRLVPEYERLVTKQQEIDRRRAAGEPVPADWIEDPFHRRYYRVQGWLE